MKIDVNVKLYMNNEDVNEILTEQELKEEWQEEINKIVKDFKSGECAEVDMISDFCADKDYTSDKLIDCIFNPQKAEALLADYRNYVANYYQGFMDNYTVIEKKIQVEI
jgi:hypothetical protein